MKNQLIVACAITTIVAGGVGYIAGVKTQNMRKFTSFGERQNGRGIMMGRDELVGQGKAGIPNGDKGMMGLRGAIIGEVTSKDDKSITVKMSDGSSKNVILSDTTSYRISNEAKIEELGVGKTVSVFGTTNSDGSTTATSIELNPALRGQSAVTK